MKKKYRLDKEQFIEFLCGLVSLLAIEACFFALLLKL